MKDKTYEAVSGNLANLLAFIGLFGIIIALATVLVSVNAKIQNMYYDKVVPQILSNTGE